MSSPSSSDVGTPGTGILDLLDARRVLYSATLTRREIESVVVPAPDRDIRVRVWRNHAVESAAPLMRVFAASSGLGLEFDLSHYDDSLTVTPGTAPTIHLVWFDADRIVGDDDLTADWYAQRLRTLTEAQPGPVLSVVVSSDLVRLERWSGSVVPGVAHAPVAAACVEAGCDLIDERLATITGSRVSREAQTELARLVGCSWLPALVAPAVKLIAVDLDGTLHHGVLGEDGIDGVVVTDEHRAFVAVLLELRARGCMLALVSKNDSDDVLELFRQRSADYGISLEEFMCVEVGWAEKSVALRAAAERCRIAVDAVVFVDDNPGELVAAGLSNPGLGLVHADDDGVVTARALALHPGVFRFALDEVAGVREADLQANDERRRLAEEALDPERYFASLGVTISFAVDDADHVARAASLSGKTNQFNLRFARWSEPDVEALRRRPDAAVVTISVTDRLSDSGIVGVLAAVREGDEVEIHEFVVSCRALGRHLEDTMFVEALRATSLFDGCAAARLVVVPGARNQPAREWAGQFAGSPEGGLVPMTRLASFEVPRGVTVVRPAGSVSMPDRDS